MSNSDTEMKEAERTVISKPIASRPSSSKFRSFSELLAGAIDPSPPSTSTADGAIAAIRPKTVRFKPTANRNSPPNSAAVISQVPEFARDPSGDLRDNVLRPDSTKPTVVYKPQAKLVSRSTVSLLANMGNFDIVRQQQTTSAAETRLQQSTAEKQQNSRPQSSANLHQTSEVSKVVPENVEEDPKTLPSPANVDRSSYDGYNWRKYGQKQVKGSEYPRSYYKCTHPNCPVKKKVERSFDGQIAEIVYKGEHNHAKPQPPKKAASSGTGQGLVGVAADGREPDSAVNPGLDSRVDVGRVESSGRQGIGLQVYEPVGTGMVNTTALGTPENSCGVSGECENGSKGMEMVDDEPRSKRRKKENNVSAEAAAGVSGEGTAEARVVVQNTAEPETAGDGFRWRKYGQKVVKGNPYPRSYYRCTSLKCNVRKHVERVSDDTNAFVTTYEGRHNHEMPIRNTNNAAGSEPEQHQAATSKDN